jgi:hypothetical protein
LLVATAVAVWLLLARLVTAVIAVAAVAVGCLSLAGWLLSSSCRYLPRIPGQHPQEVIDRNERRHNGERRDRKPVSNETVGLLAKWSRVGQSNKRTTVSLGSHRS